MSLLRECPFFRETIPVKNETCIPAFYNRGKTSSASNKPFKKKRCKKHTDPHISLQNKFIRVPDRGLSRYFYLLPIDLDWQE